MLILSIMQARCSRSLEPVLVLNEPGTPDESGVCTVRDTVRCGVMLGMREDSAKRLLRRQRGALRLPQGSWCRTGPSFMRKAHPESMRPASHCDTDLYRGSPRPNGMLYRDCEAV